MRFVTVKQYGLISLLIFIDGCLFFICERLIVCGLKCSRIVCIHISNKIFLGVKRLHNRLFYCLGLGLRLLRLALVPLLFYLSDAEFYIGMNLLYTLGKLLVNVFGLRSYGRSRLFRRSIVIIVLIVVTVIKIINIIVVGVIFIILVITLRLLLVNLNENDSNNYKHDKKRYKNHGRSALRLLIRCFARLICGRSDGSVLLIGYFSYCIKREVSRAEYDIVSFARARHNLKRGCGGI